MGKIIRLEEGSNYMMTKGAILIDKAQLEIVKDILKEKGIPRLHSNQKGSEILEVKVEVPTGLTTKQKDLLEKFGDSLNEKNYKNSKSFLDKLKKFFGTES